MTASRERRRLPAIGLLFASCAVALLLAEGALRIFRPDAASVIRYPCFYTPDGRFGYRYLPGATDRIAAHFEIDNTVTLNSLGFHDEEPLPAGASEFRVLAVGDSFTAALNLERSEVWTAVVERELRASGRPTADVVNLGIDGTGTDVHGDLLRAFVPRFAPNAVILAFYGNDPQDVLHGRFTRECYEGYVLSFQSERQRRMLRSRVDAHRSRRVAGWLFRYSYLMRLLTFLGSGSLNLFRLEFVQPTPEELGIDDRVLRARRPRLRAVVAELEQIASQCDCRFLVIPVPPRRSLDGSLRVFRNQIGETALEVVDVVPAMERMLRRDGRDRRDLFWVHDNHLNAYGNRLFGRAVAEVLLESAETSNVRRRPR